VHEPERGHFLGCDVRVLDVPTLEQPASDASGSFTVTWSPVAGDALYVLEEARRPTWSDAVEVYRGREPFMQFFGRALGVYYYRVRAVVGAGSSDWSNGVAVHVAPSTRWTTDPPAAYDANALLAVQRALVRLSAARGDMLAVLALPQHYRADDARTHVRALKSGPDIPRTWSFGALYHPWLTTPEPGTPASFRLAPPDGAAAGVIAKRAAVRGAWIEPANEPLRDVVLLTPAITADQVPALLDAQINVVLQQPRGFLCLSANTLTDDPDLRPIGVRRLLSLLRRTALLNGQDWVFEPNDATLRRGIERGFEQLLARLYSAGAFTGATPDQAYRVVVGSPPNTRQTAELGQLIVELKVAPSHPLAFLTVRLVQAGQGGLTVESR
jgi:hypothetical protein